MRTRTIAQQAFLTGWSAAADPRLSHPARRGFGDCQAFHLK